MDKHPALLWTLACSGERRGQEIALDELGAHITSDELTWVHIRSDAPDAVNLLVSLSLPVLASEALCAAETRPRMVQMEGANVIYLRAINKNPGADPEDMVSLRIWQKGSLIITARKAERGLQSVQSLREKIIAHAAPDSASGFLLTLIESIADIVSETVDDIDGIVRVVGRGIYH